MIHEKWKLIDYFFVFMLMVALAAIMVISASIMDKVFNPQNHTGLNECYKAVIILELEDTDPQIVASKLNACELLYGDRR